MINQSNSVRISNPVEHSMIFKPFKPNESSWAVLALVRFLLATIVFLVHLQPFAQLPSVLEEVTMFGGKAAVVGFLLISGVSIGHSYRHSKAGYFKRRFLRIYPLYFFAVLITVFLQYFLGSPYQLQNWTLIAAGWITSFGNFFFLQEFLCITITYNIPLWSLSIEVFFYLLVPLLFKMPIFFLYILIFASLGSFAFLHLNILYGYNALVFAWPWLIGFLISGRQKNISALIFMVLGIIIVSMSKIVTPEKFSWVIITSVAIILILSIYSNIKLPSKMVKVFNYLGEFSYPLYIFHVPVFLILSYIGVQNTWLYCLLLLLAIAPINYFFDHWLKKVFWKPFLNSVCKKVRSYHLILNNKIKRSPI